MNSTRRRLAASILSLLLSSLASSTTVSFAAQKPEDGGSTSPGPAPAAPVITLTPEEAKEVLRTNEAFADCVDHYESIERERRELRSALDEERRSSADERRAKEHESTRADLAAARADAAEDRAKKTWWKGVWSGIKRAGPWIFVAGVGTGVWIGN